MLENTSEELRLRIRVVSLLTKLHEVTLLVSGIKIGNEVVKLANSAS
jgi:hypothetical protein